MRLVDITRKKPTIEEVEKGLRVAVRVRAGKCRGGMITVDDFAAVVSDMRLEYPQLKTERIKEIMLGMDRIMSEETKLKILEVAKPATESSPEIRVVEGEVISAWMEIAIDYPDSLVSVEKTAMHLDELHAEYGQWVSRERIFELGYNADALHPRKEIEAYWAQQQTLPSKPEQEEKKVEETRVSESAGLTSRQAKPTAESPTTERRELGMKSITKAELEVLKMSAPWLDPERKEPKPLPFLEIARAQSQDPKRVKQVCKLFANHKSKIIKAGVLLKSGEEYLLVSDDKVLVRESGRSQSGKEFILQELFKPAESQPPPKAPAVSKKVVRQAGKARSRQDGSDLEALREKLASKIAELQGDLAAVERVLEINKRYQ